MPALSDCVLPFASRVGRMFPALLAAALVIGPAVAESQLIRTRTPFRTSSGSYFNRTGVNFGLSFRGNNRIRGLNAAGQITPNINVSQNSAGSTIPPFGGYDPNADLRTGVAVIGGNAGFSLGLVAGKGNTRSLVSSTPSVTMFNGQSGSIFSGENRPFVTGITPISGNGTGTSMVPSYGLPNGLTVSEHPDRPINLSPQSYENPHSTARQGMQSLAEIERLKAHAELQQQQQLSGEIQALVDEARQLVGEEKFGAARAKFSRAIRKLGETGESTGFRTALKAELEAIRDKR